MNNENVTKFNKFIEDLKKTYPDLVHTNNQIIFLDKNQKDLSDRMKYCLFIIALKDIFKDNVIINDSVYNHISNLSLYRFLVDKNINNEKELHTSLKVITVGEYSTISIDFLEKDLINYKKLIYSITMPCYDFNKLVIYLNISTHQFKNNFPFYNYVSLSSIYNESDSEITKNYFEYNKGIFEHNIKILSKAKNKVSNDISLLLTLCIKLYIDYNLLIKLDSRMIDESRNEYYKNIKHILDIKNINEEDIIKIYALFSNYATIKDKYLL